MEPRQKLFTEKQIGVAAFFGGTIAPGILIYKNLIRLNREKEAYASLAATLVFTILLIYGMISIPQYFFEKLPSQLLPALIGLLFWLVYHQLLSESVKRNFDSGTLPESNWNVAGFTFIGLILYVTIAFGVGVIEPPYAGDKLSFDRNEIYFDDHTLPEDVEKLAEQLFMMQYFSKEYPAVTQLETWETQYVVTLPVMKDLWEDDNVLSELQSLKRILEVELDKKVTITLEDYELNGKRKTKSL